MSAAKRFSRATKRFVIDAISADDGTGLPHTLRKNQATPAPACSIGTYTFRYIRSMHSTPASCAQPAPRQRFALRSWLGLRSESANRTDRGLRRSDGFPSDFGLASATLASFWFMNLVSKVSVRSTQTGVGHDVPAHALLYAIGIRIGPLLEGGVCRSAYATSPASGRRVFPTVCSRASARPINAETFQVAENAE